MNDAARPTLASGIAYRDPRAALAWLEKAFGFETSMVVENPDGTIGHSEMRFGDGLIMVGSEWDARHKSPASLEGVNTQSIHVQLQGGLDAHCERARAAGAVITREPADQFYGDRVYGATDPEGHVWTFGQTVRAMSLEEMTAAGGVSVRERL
ncbi:MAG: VOC family protein [Caulobacteraceae bacterium]|nr:VOC family protein [Caulobacteraceae bacterium]